jgi:hypothetical protein
MSMEEKLSELVETMMKVKEGWVATEPENLDLHIYLHFWRGEEMVATVVVPCDRNIGLKFAALGARGFNADTVAMTFESYHSNLAICPMTGKPWQSMEMQYVFQTDPLASEKGWVDECLTTDIHDRDGHSALSSRPFQIKEYQVIWGEEAVVFSDSEDGYKAAGYMQEYMQWAMAQPKLIDEIKDHPSALGMVMGLVEDEELRYFHMDCAMLTHLDGQEEVTVTMLSALPGTKRNELLSERFGTDQEYPPVPG